MVLYYCSEYLGTFHTKQRPCYCQADFLKSLAHLGVRIGYGLHAFVLQQNASLLDSEFLDMLAKAQTLVYQRHSEATL